MAQIACTKCGLFLDPGAQFCTNCGTRVTPLARGSESSTDAQADVRVGCQHCGHEFMAKRPVKEGSTVRCERCGRDSDFAQARDRAVPVYLNLEYGEQEPLLGPNPVDNRLLLLVKWLFAIPLYIGMFFYGIVAFIAVFLAFWAILVTGRFPDGLFNFVKGYLQYQYRVYSYFPLLLTNHWTPDDDHPLEIELDSPPDLSRLSLVLLKLPSFLLDVVGALTGFAFIILFLIAVPVWWIILVTGRYPKGWLAPTKALLQWHFRVTTWQWLMRDELNLFGTTTGVRVAVIIGIVGAFILAIVEISVGV